MDFEKPILFDLSKLRNACLDNDELVEKLLRLFISQSKVWSVKLRQAVDDEDCKAIRFISHTIKGGSSTLHATFVIDNAVKLNDFANNCEADSMGKMKQLADNIYKALLDAALDAEKYLNSLPADHAGRD